MMFKYINNLVPGYLANNFKVIPLKLFYYQTFFETWHS